MGNIQGGKKIDFEESEGSLMWTDFYWSQPFESDPGKWVRDKGIEMSRSKDGKQLEVGIYAEGCYHGSIPIPIEQIEELLRREDGHGRK